MLIFCAIVFILLLGDLLWAWNLHRRLRQFPGRVLWQTLLALFTGVQVLGLILLIFGRQWGLPAEALTVKPVIAAVYIWNFLVLLPLCCLWFPWKIVTELLRRARPPAKRNRPERVSASKDSPAPVLTRRDFVATALCAAPALATLGATGLATEQWSQFRIRRMDVPIHDLPGALDGLTIAHVTDLHVGVFTRGAILDRIVAAANALQPDLVLLTGDLINHELRDLPVALEVVRRLQARHGIFLCEGNHDLFENAGEFRQRTLDAGLRLLVNSATIVSIRDVDAVTA
jgi:hypothetical protein